MCHLNIFFGICQIPECSKTPRKKRKKKFLLKVWKAKTDFMYGAGLVYVGPLSSGRTNLIEFFLQSYEVQDIRVVLIPVTGVVFLSVKINEIQSELVFEHNQGNVGSLSNLGTKASAEIFQLAHVISLHLSNTVLIQALD